MAAGTQGICNRKSEGLHVVLKGDGVERQGRSGMAVSGGKLGARWSRQQYGGALN